MDVEILAKALHKEDGRYVWGVRGFEWEKEAFIAKARKILENVNELTQAIP